MTTYVLAASCVWFLSRRFGYEPSVVYRHLALIACATLAGLTALLAVPRRVGGLVWAAFQTAMALLLIVLYACCYVSNQSWGENLTLGIVLAHLRGLRLGWIDPFPYPHAAGTLAACVMLLALVSFRSFQAYRRLWGSIARLVDGRPYRKLVTLLATLALILGLLHDARARPWGWYGEPVANFFGWPPVSSEAGMSLLADEAAREDEAEARRYVAAAEFQPRNVVLIVVDSLRADHMSVYGYARDTTPFLKRLEKAGKLVKVDLALSTCSESYCGIATIMSSRHFHQVSSRSFKVYEVLERYGYRKRFFLAGDHRAWYYLADFYGAAPAEIHDARGSVFDVLDDRLLLEGFARFTPGPPARNFLYFFLMSAHAEGIRHPGFARWQPARGIRWLDAWDHRRAPPLEGAARAEIVNHYDNGVLQADAVIEQIFTGLDERGILDRSIVVVTADHGEGLGEHGHVGHTWHLYQENIHIPLLIYDADLAVYRNRTFATHVDIAPTVLGRLGIPPPRIWVGHSLLEPGVKPFSLHQTIRRSEPCRAVVRPSPAAVLKYIQCRSPLGREMSEELYDLASDPRELRDLMGRTDSTVVNALRALVATTGSP